MKRRLPWKQPEKQGPIAKRRPGRATPTQRLASLSTSPQLLATLRHVSLHDKLQSWMIDFFRAQADASKIRLEQPLPTPLDTTREMDAMVSYLRTTIRKDDSWGIDVRRFVLNGQELEDAMHGQKLSNFIQFVFARMSAAVSH
ncbi:hypothetical protein [Bradyrhizobium genosp. A]|uniref:hypothetical protein n=1 Tax=Bradyrhizobium genosp. A TaxID=83626 RepID=UPI003CFAC6EC